MLEPRELLRAGALVERLRARREHEDAALVERLIEQVAEASLPGALLTSGQAAKRLGVSIQTVKNWAASGRLPSSRKGDRHVFDRADVEALRASFRSHLAPTATETSLPRPGELTGLLPPALVEQYEALASHEGELDETGRQKLHDLEEHLVPLARQRHAQRGPDRT